MLSVRTRADQELINKKMFEKELNDVDEILRMADESLQRMNDSKYQQKPSFAKQRSDEYKVEELLRQYSSSEKLKKHNVLKKRDAAPKVSIQVPKAKSQL